MDKSPKGKKCEGMEGLIKEAKGLIREKPERDVEISAAIAQACFDFLPTRARLDLAGWADRDIFSHE